VAWSLASKAWRIQPRSSIPWLRRVWVTVIQCASTLLPRSDRVPPVTLRSAATGRTSNRPVRPQISAGQRPDLDVALGSRPTRVGVQANTRWGPGQHVLGSRPTRVGVQANTCWGPGQHVLGSGFRSTPFYPRSGAADATRPRRLSVETKPGPGVRSVHCVVRSIIPPPPKVEPARRPARVGQLLDLTLLASWRARRVEPKPARAAWFRIDRHRSASTYRHPHRPRGIRNTSARASLTGEERAYPWKTAGCP
jgi:hypothetical protein